jgi:UDP-N-acetyl-D-mannosaminuronic acid dehydrogenase
MPFNTITVVGLGYIGLPTAAVIASRKIKVNGLDVNQHIVDTINEGKVHIVEPELDILVHAVAKEGYLRASLDAKASDAFLIAVPTPFIDEHDPDLSYIESAGKVIAPVLKVGDLVILESTSPVGTTEQLAQWLAEARPDLTFPQTHGEASDIRIAHCPERVLPGHVIRELVENDRVIGGMTPRCAKFATDLYKIFVEGECFITNTRTAEMCKLIENSFRDVNIAFANELSIICDQLDINVWELIELANLHPRVNILQPGCGVGGHCIAVDPWFLVAKNPDEARMIRMARDVNDMKPAWVISKIEKAMLAYTRSNPGIKLNEIKIACLGLTFKPDIDDLRESPALDISVALAKKYRNQVLVVEPNIDHTPSRLIAAEKLDFESAIDEANIVLILVKHREFLSIESKVGNGQILLDIVGILNN